MRKHSLNNSKMRCYRRFFFLLLPICRCFSIFSTQADSKCGERYMQTKVPIHESNQGYCTICVLTICLPASQNVAVKQRTKVILKSMWMPSN